MLYQWNLSTMFSNHKQTQYFIMNTFSTDQANFPYSPNNRFPQVGKTCQQLIRYVSRYHLRWVESPDELGGLQISLCGSGKVDDTERGRRWSQEGLQRREVRNDWVSRDSLQRGENIRGSSIGEPEAVDLMRTSTGTFQKIKYRNKVEASAGRTVWNLLGLTQKGEWLGLGR